MRFKKKMKESGMRKLDAMIKDPSFIPAPSPRKKAPLPWLLPALISVASCALICVVVLPIALNSLPRVPGEQTASTERSSAAVSSMESYYMSSAMESQIPESYVPSSIATGETGTPGAVKFSIRMENPRDLLLHYEKNASFVGGETLSMQNEDGKAVVIPSSLYEVDSSAFKSGVQGKYSILCKGKESDWSYSYNVVVEDKTISSIEVTSSKKVYYVGESLLGDDVSIEKTYEGGGKSRALPVETALEGVDFDSSTPGEYTVCAYLTTNPSFRVEYQVEVKPLEEIAFDGTYAFTDPSFRVGEPTFVAFSIADFEVTPIYDEILISGPCHKRVSPGKVVLESDSFTQTITYLTKERSMVVSGIAGDPDMACFAISERDASIVAKGAMAYDDNRNFLAKGGYLSKQTLDYFAFMYGDCFTNEAKTIVVYENTFFHDGDVVYVGVKASASSDKGYLGTWYDDSSKRVFYTISSAGVSPAGSEITYPYTLEEKESEVIIRIKDGEILSYQKLSGTIYLLDFGTGEPYSLWRKYDPNLQALVTVESHGSRYVYVSPFGEPFQTIAIREDSISWYEIPGYFDTPLFKDTTFTDATKKSNYMSDFGGRRGDYNSYWEIVGAWEVDRLGEGHSYYLRVYEDMQMKRLGWIGFTSFHKPGEYGGMVHFEDGKEEEVTFFANSNDGIISCLEETRPVNHAIWANMPFLGTYMSEDNYQIDILESGGILRYLDNGKGYSYRVSNGGRITYLSENRIDIVLTIQDNQDNRVEETITLETKGEGYIFEFEGKVYARIQGD